MCKEPNFDECTLSEKEIEIEINNFNNNEGIDSLAESYAEEFSYTNKHVSQFNNIKYRIFIYKDNHCIEEQTLNIPRIKIDECYDKIKEEARINEDLILVLLEKYNKDSPSTFSFLFYTLLMELNWIQRQYVIKIIMLQNAQMILINLL